MLRYIRIAFIAATALVLLMLALANRGSVTLHLLPEEFAGVIGLSAAWSMPLFVILFLAIALGVLIGFVWEWLREMRLRGAAKSNSRRVSALERELAVLKDSRSIPDPNRDEVLAILDESQVRSQIK